MTLKCHNVQGENEKGSHGKTTSHATSGLSILSKGHQHPCATVKLTNTSVKVLRHWTEQNMFLHCTCWHPEPNDVRQWARGGGLNWDAEPICLQHKAHAYSPQLSSDYEDMPFLSCIPIGYFASPWQITTLCCVVWLSGLQVALLCWPVPLHFFRVSAW